MAALSSEPVCCSVVSFLLAFEGTPVEPARTHAQLVNDVDVDVDVVLQYDDVIH